MEGLTAKQVSDMMITVADRMIESADELGEADRIIGDGDHGTGMARGFREVKARLEEHEERSVSEVLEAVGTALMMKVGGAAGAIFGTMFRSGAQAVSEKEEFGPAEFASFLESALAAMMSRGKASAGDKTAVDALAPAAKAAHEAAERGLAEAASRASAAASEGVENTKNMVATVGKAKTLGERTIGYPDPGALSVSIMLGGMRDYITSHGK